MSDKLIWCTIDPKIFIQYFNNLSKPDLRKLPKRNFASEFTGPSLSEILQICYI